MEAYITRSERKKVHWPSISLSTQIREIQENTKPHEDRICWTPHWSMQAKIGSCVCVLCVTVCRVNALIMLISQFHSTAWWFPVGKTACHVPPNSRVWVWKRKNWSTVIFSLRRFLTLYDQQNLFPVLVTSCVAHFSCFLKCNTPVYTKHK